LHEVAGHEDDLPGWMDLNPLIECSLATVAMVYHMGIPVETLLFRKFHMDASFLGGHFC
jgi:hypothetical protein